MTLDSAKQIALDYLQQYFPNCIGAILFGSYASGSDNEMSDIDIALIDDNISYNRHSSFILDGHKIDVIILSKSSITETLKEDFLIRDGISLILHNGIIIKDTPDLLMERFCDFIRLSLKNYYIKYNVSEINNIRMSITNLIDDIKLPINDMLKEHFIVNKILSQIINLNLNHKLTPLASGKHKVNLFQKACPQLYEEMSASLMKYYVQNDVNALVNFCEYQLDRYGGKVTAKDFLHVIDENTKLSILFYDKRLFFLNFPSVFDFFKRIKLHVRYSYFDRSGYIVELTSNTIINYKNLEMNLFQYFKVPMPIDFFKVNLNILPVVLGDNKLSILVENEICTFYKFTYWDEQVKNLLNDERASTMLGLYIAYKFSKNCQFTFEQKKLFFQFLFNDWFVEAYDFPERLVSFESVEIQKRYLSINMQTYVAENIDFILEFLMGEEIPNELQSYKAMIGNVDRYFDESFLNFFSELKILYRSERFDLLSFDQYYSTDGVKEGNELLGPLKIVIDKFFKVLPIYSRYIIPYILIKL